MKEPWAINPCAIEYSYIRYIWIEKISRRFEEYSLALIQYYSLSAKVG